MSQSIRSDQELKKAVEKASELLQSITDYIGPDDPDKYDSGEFVLQFPRRYLRRVAELKSTFPELGNPTMASNIAYSLQLTDFYTWHLNRTDIDLTLKQMIIKSGVVTYCSVMEGLLHTSRFRAYNVKGKFHEKQKKFIKAGLLNEGLSEKLSWLWNRRQGVHLYLPERAEYNEYSYDDLNKSAWVVRALMDHMISWE